MVGRKKKLYKLTYYKPYHPKFSELIRDGSILAYTKTDALKRFRKQNPSATKIKIKSGIKGIEIFDYDSGKTTIKKSKFKLKGKRTSYRRSSRK